MGGACEPSALGGLGPRAEGSGTLASDFSTESTLDEPLEGPVQVNPAGTEKAYSLHEGCPR